MINYKVGETVVCVDAKPRSERHGSQLVRGQMYQVTKIYQKYTGEFVTVSGLDPEVGGYFSWRFIKLPEVTARSEVTSEAEAI